MKSQELQTFYRHMRHPGFLSLSTVVWFHPIMSLDRLCLALFFMLYMMFRFRVEMDDYLYLEKQARIKREQIQSLVFHSMIR